MNYAQIAALLDKYWEGETSIAEEQQLKQYFQAGNIDPRLQAFVPLFKAIAVEKALAFQGNVPMQVRSRNLAWRNWTAAASVALIITAGGWWILHKPVEIQNLVVVPTPIETPVTRINTLPDTNTIKSVPGLKRKPGIHKRFKAVMANRETPLTPQERAEAEKAYAEVKAALALVSSKLNKGRTEAAKNLNHLESLDKVFKKKKETTG